MTEKRSRDARVKKSDFFEIKDQVIINKLLDVVARHSIAVTLWFKRQSLRFDARIKVVLPGSKAIHLELPPEVSESQFNDTLVAQGSNEILGSFCVDTVNFFFSSTASPKREDDLLTIKIPPTVFKLQRRADMRIPFTRAHAPKLTFFDPSKTYDPNVPVLNTDILAYRITDISVGGLGFAARVEDAGKLMPGAILKSMQFKFKGTDLLTEGTIRHTIEAVNDQGVPILKVGVQFRELKPEYGQAIYNFVLEESRKVFRLLQEAGGGGAG